MRFLWHAFFARPDIPLLRLPWNAIAVLAAVAAGFLDPAMWGIAAAGEMVYLLTIASNAGFQQWVTDRTLDPPREDTARSRQRLLGRIGGAARQRYQRLEERRRKLEDLYRGAMRDDLLADSNRDALQKLTWLFLNLLVAQRNLIAAPPADERALRKQIHALERELAAMPSDAGALRDSKSATLRLLRERVGNLHHRAASLAEIEADLHRIETQFDCILEEALLRERSVAASVNIELTSHLLANVGASATIPVRETSPRPVAE